MHESLIDIGDIEERERWIALHGEALKNFKGFFGSDFKFKEGETYTVTLPEDWVCILYPGRYETFLHQMGLKLLGKLGSEYYFGLDVCLEDDEDFSETDEYKFIWNSEKGTFYFRDYLGKCVSDFQLGEDFFPFVNYPIMWYFFGPNLPRPERFW